MLNDYFAACWNYSQTPLSEAHTENCGPVSKEDESFLKH